MHDYRIVCETCGSENIRWDAWAAWNETTQKMELADHFDFTFCCDCDGECWIKQIPLESIKQYSGKILWALIKTDTKSKPHPK